MTPAREGVDRSTRSSLDVCGGTTGDAFMDAVAKKVMPASSYMDKPETNRPTEAEVEAAVRTLIRWTGDNPDREGLLDTPTRVMKAYREMFGGYDKCPADELGRTFEEVAG